MTTIEKIRAEIDKLYGEYKDKFHQCGDQYHLGLIDGLDMAERVLDTLESEKPMNLDELMKEAQRYYSDNFAYITSDQPTLSILTNIARHFAQWGAEHTPLPEDTVLFNKGVAEGKRLMMEELSEHIAAAYQLGLATHNPNIEPKVELIYTTDTTPVDGKELLYVSDKSYKIGWRDCKERIVSIIESRLSEIIGDAQPKPILRMELKELITRIKNED